MHAAVVGAWRLDLLSSGLLAASATGGVDFWPWGASASGRSLAEQLSSALCDGPAPPARLVPPEAQPASTDPGGQPQQLGSLPWPPPAQDEGFATD